MYKFKIEKKEEFLDGRTVTFLAKEKLFITNSYLNAILNGTRGCSRTLEMNIVKLIEDAQLDDFFDKKGE